jgi:hypothetical protein
MTEYRVTASFDGAVEMSAPDLETAARLASKVVDQGGSEVFVYADGELVPEAVLKRAFSEYSARSMAGRENGRAAEQTTDKP